METKVARCSCQSAYQDKKYGRGCRVFNRTTKDLGGGWRCTVCGREMS